MQEEPDKRNSKSLGDGHKQDAVKLQKTNIALCYLVYSTCLYGSMAISLKTRHSTFLQDGEVFPEMKLPYPTLLQLTIRVCLLFIIGPDSLC